MLDRSRERAGDFGFRDGEEFAHLLDGQVRPAIQQRQGGVARIDHGGVFGDLSRDPEVLEQLGEVDAAGPVP